MKNIFENLAKIFEATEASQISFTRFEDENSIRIVLKSNRYKLPYVCDIETDTLKMFNYDTNGKKNYSK